MSVFPYRWTWSTAHKNVRSVAFDIWYGIGNIIRWTPVIWKDRDFDWLYLAAVMEYKLTRMARLFDDGHLMNHDRKARECRVAATLLQRLLADEYDDAYEAVPKHELLKWLRANELRRKNDQRYLGLLIGKYMRGWWD